MFEAEAGTLDAIMFFCLPCSAPLVIIGQLRTRFGFWDVLFVFFFSTNSECRSNFLASLSDQQTEVLVHKHVEKMHDGFGFFSSEYALILITP